MMGILSWIGCGFITGFFMTRLMQGHDLGLVVFTIAVAIMGALVGGFGASLWGVGDFATVSLYGLILASLSALVTLVTYRKLMGV